MKRILFIFFLLYLENTLYAQYIYTIKADSVKITNSCDTAELIIENHTQTVPGFLFNKGRGRTEFRRPLQWVNDNLYLIGADSLKLNAWMQGGNSWGTRAYLVPRIIIILIFIPIMHFVAGGQTQAIYSLVPQLMISIN
jgi:hypothetical protein